MGEADQLVSYVNYWDSIPALMPYQWLSAGLASPALPDFAVPLSPLGYLQLNYNGSNALQTCISQAEEEHPLVAALNSLIHLFTTATEVVADAKDALVTYISESGRRADEVRKKLRRKLILSSAVSKDGQLSFLVPRYRRVCVETAAKDQVLHLEPLTLAEEQGARNSSASGQMHTLGGRLWKTLQSRLRNSAAPIYLSSIN